jgi:hypothetical protein
MAGWLDGSPTLSCIHVYARTWSGLRKDCRLQPNTAALLLAASEGKLADVKVPQPRMQHGAYVVQHAVYIVPHRAYVV